MIDRLCARAERGGARGGDLPWAYIHGLFDLAVYGGRVDNQFDSRVLQSYLQQFFSSGLLGEPESDYFTN